jgi:hypothetical protein
MPIFLSLNQKQTNNAGDGAKIANKTLLFLPLFISTPFGAEIKPVFNAKKSQFAAGGKLGRLAAFRAG